MGAVKKNRAKHSSEINNLRYFNLVQPSPKPFYTPQCHNPLSRHRHSLLNTIATPNRNSSRLPEAHKVSLSPKKTESGRNKTCDFGRTPKVNGRGSPKKMPDLYVRGKDVDVLINSLLSDDDKESHHDSCDDVIDDNDDVIVIDLLQEENKETEENLIDRVSPTTSTSSDNPAMSEIRPTPNVYTKFQPKSSEKKLRSEIRNERKASTAAVVELFNDDSSDDEPVLREDPLIRPTPKLITQTRKEMVHVARDPLIGVVPKIMRQGAVMKAPLVRVSPMLRRNGVTMVGKRRLKSDQSKTKGDGVIPALIKETRNEEPVIDNPLIGVNPDLIEEERSEEPSTKKRKLRSSQSKIQTDVEDEEVTPELTKETRKSIRREKATAEKRKLRSDRSKVPTTVENGRETPMVRKEEAVMKDPLAVISPKGRKSQRTDRGETPRQITNKEPTMEDPLARLSPPIKKRTLRSSCREPTVASEVGGVVPRLIEETRRKGSSRITRSHQGQKRTTQKGSTAIESAVHSTRRSTRTATARSTQSSENDHPYVHDSSESEWNSTDENNDSSSSEEEIEIEVTKKRRAPLKPINIVTNKSRKRSSPTTTPRSGADGYTTNKRQKLSLRSSRRTQEAKKLKRVRTIEKSTISTPGPLRRNGEIATPLSSRRKILTPHIPQRKKAMLGKTTSTGSRAKQFEAAKER